MGECKINHSHDDVRNKFKDQAEYLPQEMKQLFEQFFSEEHTQEILNEVFHLLKKFDLASEKEKQERTNRLYMVLKNV
jgi:citrate synthase